MSAFQAGRIYCGDRIAWNKCCGSILQRIFFHGYEYGDEPDQCDDFSKGGWDAYFWWTDRNGRRSRGKSIDDWWYWDHWCHGRRKCSFHDGKQFYRQYFHVYDFGWRIWCEQRRCDHTVGWTDQRYGLWGDNGYFSFRYDSVNGKWTDDQCKRKWSR